MEGFVDFTSGKMGRMLRIVVGIVLVAGAFVAVDSGTTRWALVAVGALLTLSGLLKMCIFNKLVGRALNATPEEK